LYTYTQAYDGSFINKLQNAIILLIFKLSKIRPILRENLAETDQPPSKSPISNQ